MIYQVFTVVITEQAHLDSIEEYRPYLLPFLEKNEVCFCRWHPDGETLSDAVPDLVGTVSRHENWRMIVVCDEAGFDQKNPFDLAPYRAPVWDPDMEQSLYLEQVRQEKFRCFEEAARQPLTKLMTWLCQSPTVTAGRNGAERDP